jgi:hypothetical protein
MLDEESKRKILSAIARSSQDKTKLGLLLSSESRREFFYERRTGGDIKHGIHGKLLEAIEDLPDFKNIEDFIQATFELDVNFTERGVEKRK